MAPAAAGTAHMGLRLSGKQKTEGHGQAEQRRRYRANCKFVLNLLLTLRAGHKPSAACGGWFDGAVNFGHCCGMSMEIVFGVTQEGDGGYVAECLSHDIFTQGSTWEELRANVREAVSAYFFDQPRPSAVRLHLVRDELLAGA